MADETDISRLFSPQYKVAEPPPLPGGDIDKLGTIGAAALEEKGYYTRIVVASDSPKKKLLDPSRTRVLIVEDDEGTGAVIEKVLHSFGCQTLRARSMAEIAGALSAKPFPHLVLLDVMLPDANGFDVLNRIRQHPQLKDIPVLMLTSMGERKDVARGLALGADGYITKPATPTTLLDAVQAVLAG
jgi:two-component system OmpR family response regulator